MESAAQMLQKIDDAARSAKFFAEGKQVDALVVGELTAIRLLLEVLVIATRDDDRARVACSTLEQERQVLEILKRWDRDGLPRVSE